MKTYQVHSFNELASYQQIQQTRCTRLSKDTEFDWSVSDIVETDKSFHFKVFRDESIVSIYRVKK